MGGASSTHEEMINSDKILVGKPEGKIPHGKRRRRCEDDIKMDLEEIGWEVCAGFIWLRIGTSRGLM
jgi:hypothetical protein